MNEIVTTFPYSDRTVRVVIHAPEIASRTRAGNFVMLRFNSEGPRIPFSIVEANPERGEIEIIIHRAEGLDQILPLLVPGERILDLLGPLGTPARIDPDRTVLCVGDGAGFVSLLPIIMELHRNGCRVTSLVSEESAQASCMSGDIEKYSDEVISVPAGKLYDIVDEVIVEKDIDKIWMSAPTSMLKKLTDHAIKHDIDAGCVLNMLMIDGIGLCGVCRVIVGGERKQTCIDGPTFNARLVDFEQLRNRQRHFE